MEDRWRDIFGEFLGFDFLPEHSPYLEEKRIEKNRQVAIQLGTVIFILSGLLLIAWMFFDLAPY